MNAKLIPFPANRVVRRFVQPAEPIDEDVLLIARALLANLPSQKPPKPKRK